MKYAVIDIGSNTIRLCIYQAAGTNFRRLFSAKETAGLASYIKKGIMRADGINKAAEVLSYFATILTQFTLKDIYVFATAPLRNISNTLQVTSALYQKTGFDIDVLSGKQEALYSYYGAMHGIQSSDGLLTDIGGGSTELVSFQDGRQRLLTVSPSAPSTCTTGWFQTSFLRMMKSRQSMLTSKRR